MHKNILQSIKNSNQRWIFLINIKSKSNNCYTEIKNGDTNNKVAKIMSIYERSQCDGIG